MATPIVQALVTFPNGQHALRNKEAFRVALTELLAQHVMGPHHKIECVVVNLQESQLGARALAAD